MSSIGKSEHNKSPGMSKSAPTPNRHLTHSSDVEFAPELADHEDKEAQARAREADNRVKKK